MQSAQTRRATPFNRRGFALMEMMFCIVFAAMIVILSGRMIQRLMRVYRDVPAAMNTIRSQQQWLDQLRQDIWSAADVQLDADGALLITPAASTSNEPIRWVATAPGELTRTGDGFTSRWTLQDTIQFGTADSIWHVQSGDAIVPLAQAIREPR